MSDTLRSFRRNAVHVRQALEILSQAERQLQVDGGYLQEEGLIERYKRLSIPVRRALNANDRASFAQAMTAFETAEAGPGTPIANAREAWQKLQQELESTVVLGGGKVPRRQILGGWLDAAGLPYDVAIDPRFGNGVAWSDADPARYSHVVFVCGPFYRSDLLRRFERSRLVGIDVSMVHPVEEWNPFDLLLERDSTVAARTLRFLPSFPAYVVVHAEAAPRAANVRAPASAMRVKVRTPAAARRGPCPLLRSRSTPISNPTASAAPRLMISCSSTPASGAR